MDILLISPDHGNKKNNFPWGILSIGSYLTNVSKKHTQILDASLYSRSDFISRLNKLLPTVKLVGIGCFTTDVNYVKELVDYIKKRKEDTKIILGGPHAVLEPEQTCAYINIDFVAYADGELTVDCLIEELTKDKPKFDNIPGLIYKENGKLIKTDPPGYVGEYPTNYDLLSPTVRKTFPDYIQVLTGRGCSYRCRFCYNSVIEQKFRPYSMAFVIKELEDVVNRYNPKEIYFRDENFFQHKNRIHEFIRLYKEKKFHFSWRATCRANYVNDKYINDHLLKELESINCEMLKMGIESGSQRILNFLRKGTHIKGIKHAVEKISKFKSIKGNYSFISGLPGQTLSEHIETIKLITFILKKEPDAEIIGPQYFRIYPGGSLYEEIVEKYNYKKPETLEEWASMTDKNNDHFGLNKNVIYPWIEKKYKDFYMHGDLLVLLYRNSLTFFLGKAERIPAIPFALIAKFRIKFGWYTQLYEIKLLHKLLSTYRKYFPYK